MAVAETPTVEKQPRNPHQQLMIASALGAGYVLAGLWLVFLGLPMLWRAVQMPSIVNEFLADSLIILVTLPTIVGLFILGKRLEGNHPPRGLRSGAVFLTVAVLLGGLLATSGNNFWAVVGLVVVVGAAVLMFQPGWTKRLMDSEDLGWFHATLFKPNQGLRVRRATVLAIMLLAICGVITLVQHGTLNTGRHWYIFRPLFGSAGDMASASHPWVVYFPFSTTTQYVFMFYLPITVPLLLLVLAAWMSWRIINWPTFADFLIATEAEMNKVSWTSRKRLYQDTIVVLVTVFLFTMYLFFVDILWIKILTNPVIDVLKHDPQEAARKNQSGAQW